MARMYPDQLDPETKSAAERLLYELFREQLDDTYVVFHSVHWLALDEQRRPRDGEADFVLAHPDAGILVVEVKGGGVRRDPSASRWTSTDATGATNTIKNPVAQARQSKYSLLKQLKTMIKRYLNIGHAVAFPDVVVEQTHLGPDLIRDIVLDGTDLPRLARWVEKAMDYWRGERSREEMAPGKEGIQALVRLLGKQWELRPALWGQFSAERRELIRLTREQYVILDVLNRQRQVAISGFAGSGKTLLAAEKASRLARQGFRVLLTCYNKNLAQDLRMRLNCDMNLDIYHFHDLCLKLAREADLPVPGGSEKDDSYFERVLPDLLLQAGRSLRRTYDAIIVDEAQDFSESWWLALLGLLTDYDHGILYFFYDDNQRIYAGTSELPIDAPPYPLTVNCRTTRHIHEQIMRFYRGESDANLPVARGPQGRPVEFVTYAAGGMQRTLQSLLKRLLTQQGVPAHEVMVLTPFSRHKSLVAVSRDDVDEVPLTWAVTSPLEEDTGQVQGATIHSAKGLERSVIVLAELERWVGQRFKAVDMERLLYVACSRASHHLIVLLPRPIPPELRRFFEERASAGIPAAEAAIPAEALEGT